jgi:1-acyl-sn-glycerol-3-phosphate acyltransferase
MPARSARVGVLRALWRLARALVHALHGAAVCAFVFPRLDTAGRMERVAWWGAGMLRALGVRLEVEGALAPAPVLLLANHVSWLDILAIDALRGARFVSKADVRHWPLIGYLVASGGTLFIERERKRDALRVVHHVAEALREGATVAVFPEGTTGPGPTVLPMHANLLQAAIATAMPVQPVALRYADATAAFSPAADWTEVNLVQSAWRAARARGFVAHVRILPPLPTAGTERRALAEAVRVQLQAALDAAR